MIAVLLTLVRRWWALALLLLGWQAAVNFAGLDPLVLPGPLDVIDVVVAEPAQFLLPVARTVTTAAIGLILGVAAGYTMAALSWLVPFLAGALTPLALVIRSVPFVALIPVLARVFGYGVTTAWVICALVCFFPTFVMVSTGLNDTPANGEDLFRVNGAARIDRFRRLAAPSAMPHLATAFRISSATAILAALVAEFLMGIPGLARVLADSLDHLDVERMWGASAIAAVLAITVFTVTSRLETYVNARWR